MTLSRQMPTLLIFTLGPCREHLRKSLLPGGLSAAERQLHQAGLDAAIDAGRSSGCRVVVASPHELDLPQGIRQLSQRGNGFSSRLRGAVQVLQNEQPGSPVVIVGTDVPGLAPEHIRTALLRITVAPDDVVLGPCPDGGFYLLATRQPIDRVLSRVNWCRQDTLASLIEALHSQGRSAHLLSPLRDLDRTEDLEAWLAHEGSRLQGELVRWLLKLLAALRRPHSTPKLGHPLPAMVAAPTGRGPPS